MFDVLIVGGGPAGLTAAVYCRRRGLTAAVCEGVRPGGQVAATGVIENCPGFLSVTGPELARRLAEAARWHGAEFLPAAEEVWPEPRRVRVNGEILEAGALIYAAGCRRRTLDIPGEREFTGRGVSYCAACDGALYRGKDVAVVGGGNSALGEALHLAGLCRTVWLLHRRQTFRAQASLLEQARACPNIRFCTDTRPVEILGGQAVERLVAEGPEGRRELAVDGVFAAVGTVPTTEPLHGRAATEAGGYLAADESCRTAIPGFYAAGDVRAKALRQIVTACADGAVAAETAAQWLQGGL